MKHRTERPPQFPRLTAAQLRQQLAAEETGTHPDCFLCGQAVLDQTFKASYAAGADADDRTLINSPCGHAMTYGVGLAEQVKAQMRLEAATEATHPDSPDLAALDTVENQAWHTVWLEGNWKWLTSKMTTEGREYAADRVAAYSLHLSQWNAEPVHTEPAGLRWWRDDR